MYFEVSKRLSLLPPARACCHSGPVRVEQTAHKVADEEMLRQHVVVPKSGSQRYLPRNWHVPHKVVGKIFLFQRWDRWFPWRLLSLASVIYLGPESEICEFHSKATMTSFRVSKPPDIDWSAITCLFGLHCYSCSCIIQYTYIRIIYVYYILVYIYIHIHINVQHYFICR